MPQMSPTNWVFLSVFYSLNYFLVMIIMNSLPVKFLMNYEMFKKNFIWIWKWFW